MGNIVKDTEVDFTRDTPKVVRDALSRLKSQDGHTKSKITNYNA